MDIVSINIKNGAVSFRQSLETHPGFQKFKQYIFFFNIWYFYDFRSLLVTGNPGKIRPSLGAKSMGLFRSCRDLRLTTKTKWFYYFFVKNQPKKSALPPLPHPDFKIVAKRRSRDRLGVRWTWGILTHKICFWDSGWNMFAGPIPQLRIFTIGKSRIFAVVK